MNHEYLRSPIHLHGMVLSEAQDSCLILRERTFSIDCIGGWVGPRDNLDTVAKGKNFSLLGTKLQAPNL